MGGNARSRTEDRTRQHHACHGMPRLARFRAWCSHAFAFGGDPQEISALDRELVQRLADWLVQRRLGAAALMMLESGRPLSFMGSQLMLFLQPIATLVFAADEYGRLCRLLERRESVDMLIEAIGARESERNE